jgi:hypothetical protein
MSEVEKVYDWFIQDSLSNLYKIIGRSEKDMMACPCPIKQKIEGTERDRSTLPGIVKEINAAIDDGDAPGLKEKLIAFTAPMVRAILDGRKTQTRRIVRFDTPCKYSEGDILLINDNDLHIEVISAPVQERLQDISEDDVFAEGIEKLSDPYDARTERSRKKCLGKNEWGISDPYWTSPISAYSSLWQSIYGKDSWDSNPWVWVIEFRMVQT